MSSSWQELERLYAEAARLSPTERAAFLINRCPASLRGELEALLRQDDPALTETMNQLVQPGPGRQLGPYALRAPLGAGGMGEVFLALDTRLGRSVAIKLLPQKHSDDGKHRRRLLQEARAASALNHPNIVTLHDICSDRGVDFLVMEYIAGQTFKDLLDKGPLDIARIGLLGAQIAGALSVAHAAGITHRDIKPANLMVTPEQHVKILDFGIAKLSEPVGTSELTVPGTVMGTIAYMSPEQARGQALDGKSDVFSLGCVLYQAATGNLPFRGANPSAVMHAIVYDHPPSPGTTRSDCPRAFDELVARCLAKSPQQRPSASEVAAELRQVLTPIEKVERLETSQPSVAVLPFHFRTAAPEDQFLSVSLADAVIHRLNATGKVLVRPTSAVMRYLGKETEWTQAARELNADIVIEGTIQKMGAKVRVALQAFRARDQQTIHSSKHDGEMADLFGIEDRVCDAAAEMFAPRTQNAAETRPPTKNPAAYELYLRGVERSVLWNQADTASAIELFTRAVQLDPVFADGWARLAQTCHTMGAFFDSDPKWYEEAESAISQTLNLNPLHADALCARAQVLWSPSRGFQNLSALRALRAALRINPRCLPAIHWNTALNYHFGFYENGFASSDTYLSLNPHSAVGWNVRAAMSLDLGDYGTAQEGYDRALLYDPKMIMANLFRPLASFGLGRFDLVRTQLAEARASYPEEPQLLAIEAMTLAHEGDTRGAERLADQAAASTKSMSHTHHIWQYAASAFALCGKKEKAVVQLRRCAGFGLPNYRLFATDPSLKSLHGDPEFQGFLTELRRESDVLYAECVLAE